MVAINTSYAQESDTMDEEHVHVLDPRILTQGRETADHQFDMVGGNVLGGVVIPHLSDWLHEVSPYNNDPTLVLRYTSTLTGVAFDAVAPYHPDAVGMYSRIENRPASESETNLLPNTAIMYATYQFVMSAAPERAEEWRFMMTVHGFDPDDDAGLDLDCSVEQHLDSPVAIGNHASKCFVDAREHDGFNQYGYETPGRPMADTTGYVPVNSPTTLVDFSRWQPTMIMISPGTYVGQIFATPQFANTATYSGLDPRTIRVPPPTSSNFENIGEYMAQVNEVLDVSSDLSDEEKATIEFFDNKRRPGPWAVRDYSMVNSAQLLFLAEMTRHDAGIVGWQEKARYDAIRPISVIRHFYANDTVMSPTTVNLDSPEILGSEWNSYVSTGNHPEYPSVTSCLCSAFAQALREYTGSDKIYDFQLPDGTIVPGYGIKIAAGSSLWEPGITPASDLLLTFDTWTDFVETCADSRVIAGLHFRFAVDESVKACSAVGTISYDYWKSLVDGTAAPRGPETPLAPDPLLNDESTRFGFSTDLPKEYRLDTDPVIYRQSLGLPPEQYPTHLQYGVDHVESRVQQTVVSTILAYDSVGAAAFDTITPNEPQYTNELYPFVLDFETLELVADGSGLYGKGYVMHQIKEADRPFEQIMADVRKDGGAWVEYLNINPGTGDITLKRAWVYLHDDYLFGSGYYLQDTRTQDVVHQAITLYQSKGIEAFDIITPDEPIQTADFYPFVIAQTNLETMAHGTIPDLVGICCSFAISERGDRPIDVIRADLNENGGTWVEYVFTNPDTGTEQLKRTWLYQYDGFIFGSGYYIPDSRLQILVETKIHEYDQDPLSIFNAPADESTHQHQFILNAFTLEVVSNDAFPNMVGTLDTHLANSNIQLGEIMTALNNDGHIFVEYLSENPATNTEQLTRTYLHMHDGLIFGAGYYFPDSRILSLTDEAIQAYKSLQNEAFDTITAGDLNHYELFPFVANTTHFVAHGVFPNHVGPIPTGNRVQVPGGEPGQLIPLRISATDTIQNALNEGIAWSDTVLPHPENGIDQVRRAMVKAYDGYVFGSGYYISDADTQSVVDYARFVYQKNGDATFDIITPDEPTTPYFAVPFILDGATWDVLAHGADPELVGECFICEIQSTASVSLKDIQSSLAREEGVWVSHVFENFHTGKPQMVRTWLSAYDGLILGSSYPILNSKAHSTVHIAITLYDQNKNDAISQISSVSETKPNPFYAFVVDPATGNVLASGMDSDITARTDWQAITEVMPLEDILHQFDLHVGIWVTYDFVHPETGEQEGKSAWLRLHDGLIFGAGYYDSDAAPTT